MLDRKINALKSDVRFNLGKSSLLSFLLFVFISLLLINQVSLSTEKDSISAFQNNRNFRTSFSKAELSNHHNKLPLSTTSNSSNQESSDENEISEEANDILVLFGLVSSFNYLQILIGENFYLFQLNQILQNCSIIALFVLHHSWKSFLI